jgi:serine phosphatase RsbU (regulator of sigma subunit)
MNFSVMHFQLAPNDKLVLISDGILEATDPHGQLFGFDRVQQHISLIALTRTHQPHPA